MNLACENAFQLISIQIQPATTNYSTLYTYRRNVSELNKEKKQVAYIYDMQRSEYKLLII